MAKRIVTKIGYVFCVEVSSTKKRYFQYIANDLTMLNSSVIRVFKTDYKIDDNPSLETIVNDDVWFYAHTILRNGIADGLWYKVGKILELGDVENIYFREVSEFSISHLSKSYRWYVWKINCETERIDELKGIYKNYDIGPVFPSEVVYNKIRTGKFGYKLEQLE